MLINTLKKFYVSVLHTFYYVNVTSFAAPFIWLQFCRAWKYPSYVTQRSGEHWEETSTRSNVAKRWSLLFNCDGCDLFAELFCFIKSFSRFTCHFINRITLAGLLNSRGLKQRKLADCMLPYMYVCKRCMHAKMYLVHSELKHCIKYVCLLSFWKWIFWIKGAKTFVYKIERRTKTVVLMVSGIITKMHCTCTVLACVVCKSAMYKMLCDGSVLALQCHVIISYFCGQFLKFSTVKVLDTHLFSNKHFMAIYSNF